MCLVSLHASLSHTWNQWSPTDSNGSTLNPSLPPQKNGWNIICIICNPPGFLSETNHFWVYQQVLTSEEKKTWAMAKRVSQRNQEQLSMEPSENQWERMNNDVQSHKCCGMLMSLHHVHVSLIEPQVANLTRPYVSNDSWKIHLPNSPGNMLILPNQIMK